MAYVKGKNKKGEMLDLADGITMGDDVVIGNAGADIILAWGGNDLINGGGGGDLIDGMTGDDTVTYETSAAAVDVNLATNHNKGGDAEGDLLFNIDNIIGSAFNDTIVGNGSNNRLYGGDGNDTLKGGGGADYLEGGDGNDIISIDSVSDRADGGEGIDTLVLSDADHGFHVNLMWGTLRDVNAPSPLPDHHAPRKARDFENVVGSEYADEIIGNQQDNLLHGAGGKDVLFGGSGNDTLYGGDGADTLIGSTGADQLFGGSGADTFAYWYLDDSVIAGGKPQDIIMDFQKGSDQIDLHQLDITYGNVLIMNNQNVGGTNYSYIGADTNHNGTLDEGEFAVAVKMAPGSTLTDSDFLI
jgi:Ca2+-binding RTX toxin-like protein